MRNATIIFCFIFLSEVSLYSQENIQPKKKLQFSGNINLTNNGFSFIPLFSLGKPASTVNLSIRGKRLSFDPQFRFDLDGMRPWSFLFIWHYQLIQKEKFQLQLGSYFPAYAFANLDYTRNDRAVQVLTPQRFFIWTLRMNYVLSDKVNLRLSYLNGRGMEAYDQTDRGNFLSFGASINKIKLGKSIRLRFNPELYFLKIDTSHGFYVAQTLSLGHAKFPISISSSMNKSIDSNINAKTFDWNIGINYSFSNTYYKK